MHHSICHIHIRVHIHIPKNRQMLDIVHICTRTFTEHIQRALSLSFSHSICMYVSMKITVKIHKMYSSCTHTQTPTHATCTLHARTSCIIYIRDDQVFTIACDDRKPGRTSTTPIRSAFASLLSQAWFLAQIGGFLAPVIHMGWKTHFVQNSMWVRWPFFCLEEW